MISIILPYWKRKEALFLTLDSYIRYYSKDEIEIIIIDDGGNDIQEEDFHHISIPLRIIHYEKKDIAKNPCIPINIGVSCANGEMILLTNPEIIHCSKILPIMKKELEELGEKGFISAACWDVDRQKWFAHTSITPMQNRRMGRMDIPKNSSLHFCSLMYKKFFNEVSGFHEVYRDGQGFEDNDFLWILDKNGGIFKTLDHCVTHHFNTKTNWPIDGHAKNKKIYEERWENKL